MMYLCGEPNAGLRSSKYYLFRWLAKSERILQLEAYFHSINLLHLDGLLVRKSHSCNFTQTFALKSRQKTLMAD